MNLRNNQITVGELLASPQARAVLQRELPMALNNPMISRARNMTLQAVMVYASRYLPQQKIHRILDELRKAN